jgi:hypothetical protein
MSTDFVEQCRELYEANDNPLYLWLALSSAAVRSDAPLPSWIMDYLRSSADALRRLKSDHKPPPGKILEALGIVRGNWNAFVEWRKDETAAWVSLDYAAFGGGDRAARELAHEQGAKFANEVEAAMQKVRRHVKRARQSRRSSIDGK